MVISVLSQAFIEGLRPLFVTEGFVPTTFDRWVAGAIQGNLFRYHECTRDIITRWNFNITELTDLSVHMYVKWHYAWGRRKWIPGLVSLPLGEDVWVTRPARASSAENSPTTADSDREMDMDMDSVSSWSSIADSQNQNPPHSMNKPSAESLSVRLRR